MFRQRAPQHPQIRLPRIDLRLQYRVNMDMFYRRLKVTEPELMAITDMSRVCWSVSDIQPHMQCAAALAYLTSNCHQTWLAQGLGMSQSTISRKFAAFIAFMSSAAIVDQHVKYPTSTRDRQVLAAGFAQACHLPNVYGSVDGTIVRLATVYGTARVRHVFRPRMRKDPAINVLITCDARGKILHFDASSPGSYHDSRVLQESSMWTYEEGRQPDGYALIGDKAFPNKPWLMPGHKNPAARGGRQPLPLSRQKTEFNTWQAKGRAVNENVMRRLKAAFPILGRIARITPEALSRVVATCVVLYNCRFIWRFPHYTPHTARNAIGVALVVPPHGTVDPRDHITSQF